MNTEAPATPAADTDPWTGNPYTHRKGHRVTYMGMTATITGDTSGPLANIIIDKPRRGHSRQIDTYVTWLTPIA